MIQKFPHHRLVARQKEISEDYSLFVFPLLLLVSGLLLGFLLGKCCFHHK